MSHGRISRANRRYPTAKRRAARYPGSLAATRRPAGLPPNLMPGVTRRKKAKNRRMTGLMIAGGMLAGVALLIGVISFASSTAAAVGGTLYAYKQVNKSLPDAAQVAVNSFETTTITDRNGVVLQQVDQPEGGWRTFVPYDQISPYVIDATVAAEDSTFWSNYGVEPIAVARIAVIYLSGSGSSGASTITQQLARGLYPDQIGTDVSVTRKFREGLAAVALTKEYSKSDILTMYLNQIFYGQRSYGIEAAANTYFQKHAKDLDLAEASLLAGLPQSPSFYDPTVRFDQAKIRQKYVLNQMVKYGYITDKQASDAWNEPLTPKTRNGAVLHAPHFTQYVKSYIEQHWPGALYNGGLTITTTLDVGLQEKAQQLVADGVAQIAGYNRNNGAMVAMVPWSGEILAMVGSASFDDPFIGGQVNYAIEKLQPGSSIKPLVYAAAFEDGWNPATVIMDGTLKEPTGNPDDPYYEPNNYSGNFYGAVSVRLALANSLNIPAVKAIKYAGIPHVIELAKRMGLVTSLDQDPSFYGLALALGSAEVRLLEHTNAYATFANEGKYVPANPILKITDSQGNVLYDINRDKPWEHATQALKAEYAYQIMTILTDNDSRSMIFGENNLFGNTQKDLGRPTAAKSGTTDGWKDTWTMGYTTDLAVGVWTGNTSSDGTSPPELPELDGIASAGPIWSAMMKLMHSDPTYSKYLDGPNGQPMPEDFAKPAGVYQGQVCTATGGQATPGFQSRKEWLVRGEGPSLRCDQMSALQAEELAKEKQDMDENGGKYVGAAWDRVSNYDDAVSGNGGRVTDGSTTIVPTGGSDSGDSVDSVAPTDTPSDLPSNNSNGDSPPIQPHNSG